MNELTTELDKKYKNQFISVSNTMIRAREYTTLLESKIEALAMYCMAQKNVSQKVKRDEFGNEYIVNFVILTVKDIADITASKGYSEYRSGGLYERIKSVALSMKQKVFIIEDKDNDRFILKNLYGDIAYESGKLYIEFEPSMKKYFMNLTSNFSKLRLPILFSFKKNGGFQLYKLLKSYAYPPNLPKMNMALRQEDLPKYEVYWNLTDLKMQMGFIDINQPLLKKEGIKENPDWEKMEDLDIKSQMYKKFNTFYTRILKPGIDEINIMSDIYIADFLKTKGKAGKVTGVTFVIQHNKAYYENQPHETENITETKMTELSEEQKFDFLNEMTEFIEEIIKPKDLKAIAEASNYDIRQIKKIYSIAKRSNGIDDIVGWMIAGLKNNYSSPVKGTKKKTDFNSFKQRKYDFDELEREAMFVN